MTFSDIGGDPLQLDQAETDVLVRLGSFVHFLVVSSLMIVPEAVLISPMVLDKDIHKGIAVQSEGCDLSHDLEQPSLNLTILYPYFLQIDIVAPFTFILLVFESILSISGSVRLSHDCEHAIAEVTLPLVVVSVGGYSFGQSLPDSFVLEEILTGLLFWTTLFCLFRFLRLLRLLLFHFRFLLRSLSCSS